MDTDTDQFAALTRETLAEAVTGYLNHYRDRIEAYLSALQSVTSEADTVTTDLIKKARQALSECDASRYALEVALTKAGVER